MFKMIMRVVLNLFFPGLVSHTWKSTVAVPGLASLPADPPVVVSGDAGFEYEIAVPAGTVSLLITVPTIIKTKIVSLVINADKAPMDIYTNDAAGSTGQHFALLANKSLGWNNTMDQVAFPLPITANITAFYINNASAVAGIFRAGFILNT